MTETQTTIPAAFLTISKAYADAPALSWGGREHSYQQLEERALRAGAVLLKQGLKKGDRCAIWLPNSAIWVEAALGALFIGAMLVPINTRLKPKEAEYIFRKSGASCAIAAGNFLGTDYALQIEQLNLPAMTSVIKVNIENTDPQWERALESVSPDEIEVVRKQACALSDDDPAEIIFTSGTTGFPKGAVLSHGQIVRAYQFYGRRAGIGPGGRYLIIAPMFHSFGFKAGVIVSLIHGACVHPMAVFNARETVELIDREKITIMGGPPTIFTSLLADLKTQDCDISSLHSIVLGGSMISAELVHTLRENVGVDIVLSAYGLTETSALVTMARAEDGIELIATTSGQVVDGMQMRCVDLEGIEIPRGEAGEIEVKGGNVMMGYFEDPERTAESFTPDGWFKTGDIGIINQEGYLAITDRKKDMFIVGGFNCYPAEIEAIMKEHPLINDIAVIGVDDERMGHVAKAYIVSTDPNINIQELIAWCRENMANFKVPRFIEVIDALPRNAMGKVQKFLLRDLDKKS